MKTCLGCKKRLPFESFYIKHHNPQSLSSRCKVCERERNRIWKSNNLEKVHRKDKIYWSNPVNKDRKVKGRYKILYGISYEDKIALLEKQNRKCLICLMEILDITKAHLDHDHKNGNIRGILCGNCNTGLGLFKDNTTLLKSAINYLEK